MSDSLTKDERFKPAHDLDERDVQAETVAIGEFICIYTSKMHINVAAARQLRDWLNKVIP